MHTRAALALTGVLAGGAWLAAHDQAGQRPQATFRSEVNYVEVDVVVTDAQGNFVPGLTAADFELIEEKQPQTIEAFSEINLPVERADQPLYSATAVPTDVASNAATAEGRVYLIVLDDLHTSRMNSTQVRRRAREFVEQYVGSNDLAAVLHTSGRGDVSQDFTSNRALVLEAIDGFMGGGLDSAVMNRINDFLDHEGSELESEAARDRDERERLAVARGAFMTIRNLANYMASLSGRRKALLLFSEGVDIDSDTLGTNGMGGNFHQMQEARDAMLEAIGAATRANVHVYSIDAGGLAGSGIDASVRALPTSPNAVSQGLTSESLDREKRNMQGTLRTIADQTGGMAIVNTNSFAQGFSRIVRENSTYYLLGYYPTAKRDGKFHKLTVNVKRPGLQVKSRAGYYAPKASSSASAPAPDPIREMITAAVPNAGLPMRLSAVPFKYTTDEATVPVALDLPPDVFRFEMAQDVASEDLELVYQLIDPNAKVVVSSSHDVLMRLRPETRALVEERGFRVVFPVTVKPGRYQIRVVGRTTNGARQGSVFGDLVVPDFFDGKLVWSGITLTSADAASVPTRPSDADMAKTFPLLPTAVRRFASSDTLGVYAEAYDNDTASPHAVDLKAVIRDDAGKAVFTTSEERSSAELGGGRGGYGFRVDVPLATLPPGHYVLTLTATSRTGATAARDVPFEIS
jgi:VWFA-related protein